MIDLFTGEDISPAIGETRICPDCRRPQHYTGHEVGWCHDALIDTWHCADPAHPWNRATREAGA